MNTYRQMNPKGMTKQDSYIIIGTALGAGIDSFYDFPADSIDWCRRALCWLFGGLIVAPLMIHIAAWTAQAPGFGWLSPVDSPVTPFLNCAAILSAEPMISLMRRIAKIDLPHFLDEKIKQRRMKAEKAND